MSQFIYTERYESKWDRNSSSINLIRCSRLESVDTSQSTSDDQAPYVMSSTSQRNNNYEEVEKAWPSGDPSRSISTLPEVSESQLRERTLLPYSSMSLLPPPPLPPQIHTIILDFSMVHLVDAHASVVLRQVGTEEAFARALIPSYAPSPPAPSPNPALIPCCVTPRPLET